MIEAFEQVQKVYAVKCDLCHSILNICDSEKEATDRSQFYSEWAIRDASHREAYWFNVDDSKTLVCADCIIHLVCNAVRSQKND